MDTLYELTRQLIKLAVEKRLLNELRLVMSEIPEEFVVDFYRSIFRPVMVSAIKEVRYHIRYR